MLIDDAAYGNRWRHVSPAAKSCFALAALAAALLGASSLAGALTAVLLAAITCGCAGVAWATYLRVAAWPLGFLALACLSLLVSIGLGADGSVSWRLADDGGVSALAALVRSLAALAALLFLVLTTPLVDLIALLRRLRVPAVLLDLMVIAYRMLFVLAETMRDMRTAQAARLGYRDARRSLASLGLLAANLIVQVWQRAQQLQAAAQARNGEGALRFLSPQYASSNRDTMIAAFAGSLLIAGAVLL